MSQIKLKPDQDLLLVVPFRSQLHRLESMLHVAPEPNEQIAYCLPTKSGYWRNVMCSKVRLLAWIRAWNQWWAIEGMFFRHSPEMWRVNDQPQVDETREM